MVKAVKTVIPGLLVFYLDVKGDNRGSFREFYNKKNIVEAAEDAFKDDIEKKYLDIIKKFNPVQSNESFNLSGVTRGMHAEPWNKYISVAGKGKVHGAWVDLREESYGKVFQIEITSNMAVFVPKGVANGFQACCDTSYIYLVDDYWSLENKDKYDFVNMADSELGIRWPNPIVYRLISEDDKNHPFLSEKEVKFNEQ